MDLNLTAVIVALIGCAGTIVGSIGVALINSRMKDKQAAEVLSNAVKNSVGIAVQVAEGAVQSAQPHVSIPGVPVSLQPSVQYVLDHAGDEAARFGVTPAALADKVNAQIGLTKLSGSSVLVPVAPVVA